VLTQFVTMDTVYTRVSRYVCPHFKLSPCYANQPY